MQGWRGSWSSGETVSEQPGGSGGDCFYGSPGELALDALRAEELTPSSRCNSSPALPSPPSLKNSSPPSRVPSPLLTSMRSPASREASTVLVDRIRSGCSKDGSTPTPSFSSFSNHPLSKDTSASWRSNVRGGPWRIGSAATRPRTDLSPRSSWC